MFSKKRTRRITTIGPKRQQFNDYYRSQTKDKMSTVVRPEGSKRKSRINKRQASLHLKRLPQYIAGGAIVCAVLFASMLQTSPTILVSEDESLHNKQHYVDSAQVILRQSLFNRSKLSFDSVSFKNKMLKANPELKDVNVAIPLTGRKLTVGLRHVPAVFLFKASSGNQVIVGANGIVQAKATDIEASKLNTLLVINDSAPIKTDVGSAVLLPSDVTFINTVVTDLNTANIQAETVSLPLGAGEVHVIPKGATYTIKFLISGDPKQQTGAYLTVLKQPNIIQPQTQYIDVRLAERVFVK